jgi:hypothetical protein
VNKQYFLPTTPMSNRWKKITKKKIITVEEVFLMSINLLDNLRGG